MSALHQRMDTTTPLPRKKYQIIYADPPWDSNSQFGRDKEKGNEQHYPLMPLDAIKQLPIDSIADENCVLLLWVVDTQIFDAKEVIEAWGFTYKTVAFTWAKETATWKDHFGPGMWTRKNPEMCLLATKGHPKRQDQSIRQLQRYEVREHSRKPDEFREEIVRLCGDVPRIELFARQVTPGWDGWGNEVGEDLPVVPSKPLPLFEACGATND